MNYSNSELNQISDYKIDFGHNSLTINTDLYNISNVGLW